jgi:DNA-binding transcriptional ArsR family regulator
MANHITNPKPPTVHLDREALAVLAHPLRSRLLAELRVSGPATATMLAAVLHTNSGATSYHLRKLAQAALVVDSGEGKGRRRLWSANTETRPRDEDSGDDADAEAALTWLARDYLHHFADRAEEWLNTQDDWPVDWRDQVGLSDRLVQVTAGQLTALRTDLDEVLERYRRVGAGNPSAKRVSVYVCPLPVDRPPA